MIIIIIIIIIIIMEGYRYERMIRNTSISRAE